MLRFFDSLLFLFVLVIGALLPSVSQAQAQSCNRPTVFFVNGVWNSSPVAARESAAAVKAALLEKSISPYNVSFNIKTIYNPTNGILGDLAEVAESQSNLRGALLTTAAYQYFLSLLTDSAVLKSLASRLARDVLDGATTRNKWFTDQLKEAILAEIKNNRPVVLVTHSQGNIYVNEAVRQLKSDGATSKLRGVQAIGVVGIGNASNVMLGDLLYGKLLYRYSTLKTDVVIRPLSGNPPANFDNFIDIASDLTGHKIVDAYLSDEVGGYFAGKQTTSRQVVVDLVREVYNNVGDAWPCLEFSYQQQPAKIDASTSIKTLFLKNPAGAEFFVPPDLMGSVKIQALDSVNNVVCSFGYLPQENLCQHIFAGLPRIEKIKFNLNQGGSYADIEYDARDLGLEKMPVPLNPVSELPVINGRAVFSSPLANGGAGVSMVVNYTCAGDCVNVDRVVARYVCTLTGVDSNGVPFLPFVNNAGFDGYLRGRTSGVLLTQWGVPSFSWGTLDGKGSLSASCVGADSTFNYKGKDYNWFPS